MNAIKTALGDTWRGLIQRRLWPVALLLALAVVAVPVLLLAKPEPATTLAPAQAEVAGDAAALAAQPLVAAASATDRERVRRVLGDRKDPFKPTNQPKRRRKPTTDHVATSADTGSSPSSGSSGTGSARTETQAPPSLGGSPPPTATPSEPAAAPGEPRRAAGSLTVRWGDADAEELTKIEVERLDPLPTADDPLLVHMGLTKDRRSAMFMIDADIVVDGDGRCRPTPADCRYFELSKGETAFITVTGEDGRTTEYRLDLVRIHEGSATASAASKGAAAEARATSRALRSLGHSAPAYRFDARTGTLERIEGSE